MVSSQSLTTQLQKYNIWREKSIEGGSKSKLNLVVISDLETM